MAIKKSLMLASAITSLGLASVMALSTASAATNDRTSLVDKIATKFNLNKDEVKKVFEEDRAEHQAEHKAKFEERLTQAVKDGKITEDQKAKILAKMDELEKEHEANKAEMEGKTEEERKATMEAKREELKQWATDNNIPKEFIRFGHGPGRRGPGGPGGPGHERQ